MRRAAATVTMLLILISAFGCKRGEVTATAEQQQPSQEEAALKDLLKYAQATGQTLEQLQQTLNEWKASQRAEEGPSSIQLDLDVLASLLVQAKAAVDKQSVKESTSLIARMSRVARGLLAELPGQRVAVRVERALSALNKENPDVSAASEAILAALDACLKAKDAALVPNVVKELEAAKQAATQDPAKAKKHLMAVLDTCAKDQTARMAYYIVKGLEGAFGAVGREAWPVAKAELEQVGILIDKLRAAARGEKAEKAEAAQAAPSGEGEQPQQPAAPEASSAGEQPSGEAPAAEGPAQGEAAAQPEGRPPAAEPQAAEAPPPAPQPEQGR